MPKVKLSTVEREVLQTADLLQGEAKCGVNRVLLYQEKGLRIRSRLQKELDLSLPLRKLPDTLDLKQKGRGVKELLSLQKDLFP
jgi:hypothetical protein